MKCLLRTAILALLIAVPIYAEDSESETRRVGDIQPDEVSEVKTRRESLRLWSFGLGPFYSNNLNSKETMYGVYVGRNFEAAEKGEIRTHANVALADDGSAGSVIATLGGAFMPMTTDLSPLFGADLGLGFMDGSGVESKFGFVVSGNIGARVFRTSNTQLELLFKYTRLFDQNELGVPSVYGVQLGVLF